MIQVSDIGRRERLIVARLPTQLEILIGTGESPAQQYDLLRRARCLSPTALAARASVIDLLDRTARALTKPAPSSSPPEPMMLGGPTIAERLLDALYAADFLDRDRSAHFQIPARDPELVGPFVERMRATNDTPLEPWPVEQARTFSGEYIAGHLCRTYDKDAEESFPEAQRRMESAIESSVRRDIGGDRQRIHRLHTDWNYLGFKHLLLPIWLLTVAYQAKIYQVYINGLTGEVQGDRPWSKVKIAFAITVAVLVVILAIVLYSHFKSSGGDGSSGVSHHTTSHHHH